MTHSPGPTLELELQNRLLVAVSEVGRYTRLGLTAIREDIQTIGGLQAAKKRLRARGEMSNLSKRPSDYFLTTKRVGRMDLSIEAIALEPGWQGLFAPEEIDQAMATLSEYGFAPTLEALIAPSANVQVPVEHEPSLARISLGELRDGNSVEAIRSAGRESSECEVTAKSATVLRSGGHPTANAVVRKHVASVRNAETCTPTCLPHLNILTKYQLRNGSYC